MFRATFCSASRRPRCATPSVACDTERRLYLGLGLAERVFGVGLPPEVTDRIRESSAVRNPVEDTVSRVFGRPIPTIPFWRVLLYAGRTTDSPRGVAETFARSLLEPRIGEYELLPLPGRYHFLYYPVRPVRTLFDHLGSSGSTE